MFKHIHVYVSLNLYYSIYKMNVPPSINEKSSNYVVNNKLHAMN